MSVCHCLSFLIPVSRWYRRRSGRFCYSLVALSALDECISGSPSVVGAQEHFNSVRGTRRTASVHVIAASLGNCVSRIPRHTVRLSRRLGEWRRRVPPLLWSGLVFLLGRKGAVPGEILLGSHLGEMVPFFALLKLADLFRLLGHQILVHRLLVCKLLLVLLNEESAAGKDKRKLISLCCVC